MNFKKVSHIGNFVNRKAIKNFAFVVLILTGIRAPLEAQMAIAKASPRESEVQFSVHYPADPVSGSTTRESFPVRNYVFFDVGSTKIPDRYVLLNKDQVNYFKEEELLATLPKERSTRSEREKTVYYNILNILGERMWKNPPTTITLVGTSAKSPEDGWEMAKPIKQYLVNVFGIDVSRIVIAGRYKPINLTGRPAASLEQHLQEEERKVFIESSWPALLMEFQNGPDESRKSEQARTFPEPRLQTYPSLYVEVGKGEFSSWFLQIRDERGKEQYFGPYIQDQVSIPGKSILGNRPEGNYTVTMIGQTNGGNSIKKESSIHMVRSTPSVSAQGERFSVRFGLNEWRAMPLYEKYLSDIVTPRIPNGGTVVVHGYPDGIAREANSENLSLARANDVVTIIENTLLKANRTDVTFEVISGEGENGPAEEDKLPEERLNNQSVIIEVIPDTGSH